MKVNLTLFTADGKSHTVEFCLDGAVKLTPEDFCYRHLLPAWSYLRNTYLPSPAEKPGAAQA